MKLRCTHNSIRIRVRKSDLDKLDQEGQVKEQINLGGNVIFEFSLNKASSTKIITANLQGSLLSVSLPESSAHHWIHSNEVGMEITQALSKDESLHILIEKDFPCTDRENEDKSDTFWELAGDQPEAC